ncbi:MAG: hypothetical protein BWY70_00292 [Bacteroidetes bacterium ADurb.Bin408]|nr:MAG: hypothetical protein BWY70_00292 [Bacteroidetes bacterium ADurb.Bin408]
MKSDEKNTFKTKLIELCKAQHLKTIENLRSAMEECQQMANDYGPPKDRYDAFRSQMLRKRDLYAQQMQKANHELVLLTTLKPGELKDKVEFGAVVVCDKATYFVSISMGLVKCEGQDVLCISPAVPVYKALAGLKAGNTTHFNNNPISIQDVY